MTSALFCHVDPKREGDRLRLRADHLAYVAAHRHLILAGGPTLNDKGAPDIMVLLLDLSVVEARELIDAEPYTANGVFSSVEIKPWACVIPEVHVGALDEALAIERSKNIAE